MPSLPQGSGPVSRERPGLAIAGQSTAEETLRASHQLLRAIAELQSEFIRGSEAPALFERLLAVVLELTGSGSGLIGEVLHAVSPAPSLQILASIPREEGDALWPLTAPSEVKEQEAHEPRVLVHAIHASGKPVLTESFLGLPLDCGGERVGLVILTGRPGGYDSGLVDFLQPFIEACGSMLLGGRNERRRRAEREPHRAQESFEERLRMLIDGIHDGVWELDPTTGRMFVNRHWLGMLGYAWDELPHDFSTWALLSHPEDVAESDRLFQEHLAGRTPFIDREQRLRRKDGEWAWVLSRARVVARDEQGRPLRMVGTNVDITARKLAEERLRALVRTLPDMVFRLSSDGTYLDCQVNDHEDLLIPPETVIGTNIRQMPMSPQLVDKMFTHLGRAIRDESLEVFEYVLEMPLGPRYFEARMFRSGPDEAVSIVRNITERKLAEQRVRQQEEELRRHRDSLEEQVRNRSERLRQATLELEEQQSQLIQAEKLASLGQMAAGVAHEVNNPVSYVMSNLGTLDQYVSSISPLLQLQGELVHIMESGEPAPVEMLERLRELWDRADAGFILEDMPELIEESLSGTRHIKEIAQSLRSFAREDSGEPQLVDVNTELASTLKMVWNELKYKCEVKRDFGPLPPVSCHPTQLAQVFTNLLVNAAQAMDTKGEIRIRTRHEGEEVVVEISDTGKGMTQETLSKLFTPFFTTKPRGQGTGLGLSVSYGIITRHKGRIDVQSEPGKGSTFTVRLPAAER
ncbi:PAS domain-containing protein [Archangium violaceum]|uniref:PAS domain-containing sensor histidine kinase n=1 Tax=Archangium violaceum TaxID=83451 RepID=UPI00194FF816|nr:ATP-binding protein [Archangium violaceum]QRN94021.1 PAS domain-containing protein [Archangium violaceum]